MDTTTKSTNKERVVAWLPPEMIEKMASLEPINNMKNHSEFIGKAVDFYIGYLGSQDATLFLCNILQGVIQGTIQVMEHRVATNLFRLSVEIGMMMHLLAANLDIPEDELYKLRGRCVREVKATKGKIKLDDAVEFQQSDDEI